MLGDDRHHVVHPVECRSVLPYTADGKRNFAESTEWPDAMIAFTAMAAATTTLEFVTAVFILPLRHPVVVQVRGEVDSYTEPLLRACLRSQITRPAVRELVVDLRKVTFLGAVGIAALLSARDSCRARSIRFTVRAGAQRHVLRPLEEARATLAGPAPRWRTWRSGGASRTCGRSAGLSGGCTGSRGPRRSTHQSSNVKALACESITPLGLPVEPDV